MLPVADRQITKKVIEAHEDSIRNTHRARRGSDQNQAAVISACPEAPWLTGIAPDVS